MVDQSTSAEELMQQVDRLVEKMTDVDRACNTCGHLKPASGPLGDGFTCTVDYQVPANIFVYPALPQGDSRRFITKPEIDRWKGRRLRPCAFWIQRLEAAS